MQTHHPRNATSLLTLRQHRFLVNPRQGQRQPSWPAKIPSSNPRANPTRSLQLRCAITAITSTEEAYQ
jgi:hypothetical protein